MKKNLCIGEAVLLAFGLATSASAEDFCSTAQHSGTSKTETGSYAPGSIGQYDYQLWYDRATSASATFYSDGSMSCSFQNAGDYLCRSGLQFNSDKTYDQMGGDIIAEFKLVKQSISGVDYSYVGVYGWMENVSTAPNGLVEYYVVDNTLADYMPGDWVGDTKKGTYLIDGAEYTVYRNTRTGPAIGGNSDREFHQYFSIRKTPRDCGTINVSAHIKKWKELGMSDGKLYEAKVLGEAGSTRSGVSGTADFPHAKVYIGTGSEPEHLIERSPYGGSAAVIPGTIEAENFDAGNEGDSYSGARGASGTDGDHTYRGDDYALVDIVAAGTGRAIGYTAAGEWLEYTVNVSSDGDYEVAANVANGSGAGTLELSLDGNPLTTLSFTGTADDWNAYELAKDTVALTAGEHVLRITIVNANTNVDYVQFSPKDKTNLQKRIRLNVAGGEFEVFDLQGKALGHVKVPAGSSLSESLASKFYGSGVYMVKQGSRFEKIRVTR